MKDGIDSESSISDQFIDEDEEAEVCSFPLFNFFNFFYSTMICHTFISFF